MLKSSFTIHDKSEENNLDCMYGMDRYSITKRDIKALLEGKILYSDMNGEYAATIELVKETKPVEKYRNACGSCKYFEEAEITNKVWRKCPTVYKRGVHAGERRPCSASLQKCCDYVRKEGEVNV